MIANPTHRWLSAAALATALAAGCSHTSKKPCASCAGAIQPYSVVAAPVVTTPMPVPVVKAEPKRPPVISERYTPPPTEPTVTPPPHTTAKMDALAIDNTTKDEVSRRTFGDITARPQFAHAQDYSWLVGELHYNSTRKEWRLRYASVDEEDRYGGGVTLDGAEHMLTDCKSGQMVKVEGFLRDPESREPSPGYVVRGVTPLAQK